MGFLVAEVVESESLGMELREFDRLMVGFGSLVEWWWELGTVECSTEHW